jgi:hypothetical protein
VGSVPGSGTISAQIGVPPRPAARCSVSLDRPDRAGIG